MSEWFFKCKYCGTDVDPNASTTYRQVTGWERKATAESRRGGSDIVLRDAIGNFACSPCIRRRQEGVHVNQASLL